MWFKLYSSVQFSSVDIMGSVMAVWTQYPPWAGTEVGSDSSSCLNSKTEPTMAPAPIVFICLFAPLIGRQRIILCLVGEEKFIKHTI